MICLKHLSDILSFYHIPVKHIVQVTDKVFQIDDGRNRYALKKSILSQKNLSHWEEVYNLADKQSLKNILPIYVTKYKTKTVFYEGNYYYVSPWLTDAETPNYKTLFQAIGFIHHKTKQHQSIDQTAMTDQFRSYRSKCKQYYDLLLRYVEYFEAEHYMSPLGLQVCTHFRDIELAIHSILKKIDDLLQDKDIETWSFSLCHGKLSLEHLLFHSSGSFLINWEYSSYDYPIFDLISLFQQEVQKFHFSNHKLLEGLAEYMTQNELTTKELYLLVIYLLDFTTYLGKIDEYFYSKNDSMIYLTRFLQQEYRIIQFGLQLSAYIDQELDEKVDEI